MNADRFLVEVVRPVLREMDMWSWAAEKLLIMTACHESGGFRYRKQVNGPAVSFFQIEPRTFEDIWNRYLMARSDRFAKVVQFLPVGATARYALEHDDKFACAVARMKYAAVPDPLPDVTDDEGLAR